PAAPTVGCAAARRATPPRFVSAHPRRSGASILLTSHYMDDVVALCKRVIVIHHGRLLYDGALTGLAERMAPHKLIRVTLSHEADLASYGEVISHEENTTTLKVSREEAADRTAQLVHDLQGQMLDLTLEDPAIEEVIDRVFSEAQVALAAGVGGSCSGATARSSSPRSTPPRSTACSRCYGCCSRSFDPLCSWQHGRRRPRPRAVGSAT